MLELYVTCEVLRNGAVVGEITGPASKLLGWAVEDYGQGITLCRVYA